MLKKIVGSVMALVMLIISLCSCNYANLRGFTDDQIDQDDASAQMKKILADFYPFLKPCKILALDLNSQFSAFCLFMLGLNYLCRN